jgi:hypothetical protein
MQPCLAVLLLVAFCTGCFAMQRTPDATVLGSLQTIAVIPVEPPVSTHVSTPSGGVGFNPGAYGLVLLPVVGFIVIGTLEANRVAAIPEGALTLEKEPDVERRMLTVELARAAATILQRFGARTAASVVDGYLSLPVTDRAMSLGAVRSENGYAASALVQRGCRERRLR